MAPPAIEDERTVRRAAMAASIGNVAEWYDFGIYSYLAAVVLDRVFFPEAGQWSLVLTWARSRRRSSYDRWGASYSGRWVTELVANACWHSRFS